MPVSLVLAIISIVYCVLSKKAAYNNKLNAPAIAGLVCSIIAIVVFVLVVVISIAIISFIPALMEDANEFLIAYGYEPMF